MGDFLERLVREALCPELVHALVTIYCKRLSQPQQRAGLRALLADCPEVLREFDALDALHAEYPFTQIAAGTLEEELALLYRHHRPLGNPALLRQLRALCEPFPALTSVFMQMDEPPGQVAS